MSMSLAKTICPEPNRKDLTINFHLKFLEQTKNETVDSETFNQAKARHMLTLSKNFPTFYHVNQKYLFPVFIYLTNKII